MTWTTGRVWPSKRNSGNVPAVAQTEATVADAEPVVAFAADPPAGAAPLSVDFTDLTTSYDPIVSWLWDFDDGSPGSVAQSPTHVFSDPGSYDVSLTVTDDDGSVVSGIATVTVVGAVPSLGPWGLVALALAIGASGAWRTRQSKKKTR